MRNTYITKFENFKSTKDGSEINLLEWLKDESQKDLVLKIRSLKTKEEKRRLKEILPCVTISGTFSQRKADALIKHSGFICIDIDGHENPNITDFKDLRNELKNIINIAYCSLSVGGNGVFCLIRISDTGKHKEHFEAIELCFSKLGIKIDPICKDVSRLRICSYDPEAYFNEEAITFNQVLEYKKRETPKKKVELPSTIISTSRAGSENDKTAKRVIKIINDVNQKGTDITDTYDNWFKIGCALSNYFGEQGRDMYHDLSQHHYKYSTESTDNQFDQCLKSSVSNPIGIGTFFFIAESYGFK